MLSVRRADRVEQFTVFIKSSMADNRFYGFNNFIIVFRQFGLN